MKTVIKWLATAAGVATGTYASCVAVTWCRYGTPSSPPVGEADDLLDRFMPVYDVVERHQIRVAAPAARTLAFAKEMDLTEPWLVRAIFRAREIVLGANPGTQRGPHGVLAQTLALGWVVLEEIPDRVVVVGAVTKPWEADVTFRAVAPERFASFAEPDYAKIVWTLRADPIDEASSRFRTETRAIATDLEARRKFRRYWAFLSPGINLIRWLSLGPLKANAERGQAQSDSVTVR